MNCTADSNRLCAPNGGCSICWPQLENWGAECHAHENFVYENITLRNVTIGELHCSVQSVQ